MRIIIIGCGHVPINTIHREPVIIIGCGLIEREAIRREPFEVVENAIVSMESMEDEMIEMNIKAKNYDYFAYTKEYPNYPPPVNDPFFTLLFSASAEKKRRYFTHRRN